MHRVPSVVFLRGPGALPAVYDASNTKRLDIAKLVADNSWQVLLLVYSLAQSIHLAKVKTAPAESVHNTMCSRCNASHNQYRTAENHTLPCTGDDAPYMFRTATSHSLCSLALLLSLHLCTCICLYHCCQLHTGDCDSVQTQANASHMSTWRLCGKSCRLMSQFRALPAVKASALELC